MNWVSIGSDNSLLPVEPQAIIPTNIDLLWIGPFRTNLSEILISKYKTNFRCHDTHVTSPKWGVYKYVYIYWKDTNVFCINWKRKHTAKKNPVMLFTTSSLIYFHILQVLSTVLSVVLIHKFILEKITCETGTQSRVEYTIKIICLAYKHYFMVMVNDTAFRIKSSINIDRET